MRKGTLTRHLYSATLLFLISPYLVFLGGWVRQPYSTIVILLLAAGFVFGIRRVYADTCTEDDNTILGFQSIFLVLLPAILIGLVTGAGGWGIQDSDWLKHNALLRDLVNEPWPVVYEILGEKILLTYYTAYHLPAGFIGSLLGWEAANHTLFIFTLIGLCLAALWVWLLAGARYWWVVLVFFGFSGMDVVGQVFSVVFQESSLSAAFGVLGDRLTNLEHIEWWAGWGFASFNSNATLTMWVPNQGIAGWLLTALILSDARYKCLHTTGVLYLALSTLWAPFVSIGLFPFVVVIVLHQWYQERFSRNMLMGTVTFSNVSGIALGIVIAIYMAARFQPYNLPIDVEGIYKEVITFTFYRRPHLFWPRYILFLLLEFAVLHALLYAYLMLQKRTPFQDLRKPLMLSSLILIGLPILNWGWNNEPAMRTSIPALFITALVTIYVLSDSLVNFRAVLIRRAIIAVLAVGAVNPLMEYGRHATAVYQSGGIVDVPRVTEVQSIFELQENKYKKYYSFVQQYLGSVDSYFMTYLAKQP